MVKQLRQELIEYTPYPDLMPLRSGCILKLVSGDIPSLIIQKDILKTNIIREKTASNVEQFTINLDQLGDGIGIYIEWADTRLVIPVLAQ